MTLGEASRTEASAAREPRSVVASCPQRKPLELALWLRLEEVRALLKLDSPPSCLQDPGSDSGGAALSVALEPDKPGFEKNIKCRAE